jgi:Tol biopolymer transport system component
VYGNFKAFSPDGEYLVTTYGGALLLYDGVTGEYLNEIPLGYTASHPDWSPDGEQLALVLTGSHSSDWTFTGGQIAVMDHLGDGSFTDPVVIHDPGDSYNAYYPTWSPDGEWIAFNISTEDAYDDVSAELYAMTPDGSVVVELEGANMAESLTNSWPKWAPLPDDDILWLAFASKRDYGTVTSSIPQIWVTGFDPAKAALGVDPSWPAFWLPNQDAEENNHIPVWVE